MHYVNSCLSHKLTFQQLRYNANVNMNSMLCTKCNLNQVEDEYHFMKPVGRDYSTVLLSFSLEIKIHTTVNK